MPQVSVEKPEPSFGLYDLAKPGLFDGLILTSDIAYGTSAAELKVFSDLYGSLPIVTQSVELDGATMFVPGNAEGIRAVVRHLIEEHGYKRIAFICGIPGQVDAEQRLQAYKDELKAHDLRYDEDLVVGGDYTAESGRDAIHTLLDYRKLRFQAVVAASYGQGTYMGVGNHTSAIASTGAVLQKEYGALTASSTRRQTVAVATAAYGTVSFTQAYASTDIPDASVVNAVGIFGNSSAGTGPAYSIATFASSSKASTQALNVTYVWNFAT